MQFLERYRRKNKLDDWQDLPVFLGKQVPINTDKDDYYIGEDIVNGSGVMHINPKYCV